MVTEHERIRAVKRIDDAIDRIGNLHTGLDKDNRWVDPVDEAEMEALAVSTIRDLCPPGQVYRETAEGVIAGRAAEFGMISFNPNQRLNAIVYPLLGTLRALRRDYDNGYLAPYDARTRGEMLSGFLVDAERMLGEGFKDPAAVMVGGTLELHLQRMVLGHKLRATREDGAPLASGALNDALAKSGAISNLDHENIRAWLVLRNHAAHARWDQYTAAHVALMLAGVREFVARLPA